MELTSYKLRDLQNLQTIIATVIADAGDIEILAAAVDDELARRINSIFISFPTPAVRRRPDNLTTCSICGSPAVIVPLSRADRSVDATHAIQCQNRPATDQPWRDGMCGHTEYAVRGDK